LIALLDALIDISQMAIILTCDTIGTMKGDRPDNPDDEGVMQKCDSNMSDIKSYWDIHKELTLITCSDDRLGQYYFIL